MTNQPPRRQPLTHVLVADDEAPIRLTLSDLLRRRGYEVTTAENGEAALALLHQRPFDLLLLDLKMPGLSGIEVARRGAELHPDAKIIILTGHGTMETAIDGLHLGVFDYLLKTSSPRDVLARVEAALAEQRDERRRRELMGTLQGVVGALGGAETSSPAHTGVESYVAVGDLEISSWNQTVRRGEQVLNLTPTEFRILACLAQQAGQVMAYREIVQCAHGYDVAELEASELVKPHMYHLRQKLEADPGNPRYILTVRGTGYMLADVRGAMNDER